MGIEKMEAIVMRTFPFGDTSRIAHLFSVERGRVHVLAKGVRGPRGRFGAALEPFTRIGAVIYYKNGRDLQFLSQAEILGRRPVLGNSLLRFAYAGAVLELLDQALAGEEPPGPLFTLIDAALSALEAVPEDGIRASFMGYIAGLLHVLGYRPELVDCVGCNRANGNGSRGNGKKVSAPTSETPDARSGLFWSALRGGLLCERCATTEPTAAPLSADCRAGLAALLGGNLPSSLPRPLGDEMARTLDGFLRAHLPRYRGLRSLKVIRELTAAAT
ncbi:MAG TPA: DNA repair protein RecO [Candidatus Udaeobacter sp.]|nr:DNA repair protein RecO [Candidatus Udaeobacter sp.]